MNKSQIIFVSSSGKASVHSSVQIKHDDKSFVTTLALHAKMKFSVKENTDLFTFSKEIHCVKSIRSRSFSGPFFLTFGLNTKRYGLSLLIQSECGKIRTRKTPNTDTFHAVILNRKLENIYCLFPENIYRIKMSLLINDSVIINWDFLNFL